jgi:hypothetical protein
VTEEETRAAIQTALEAAHRSRSEWKALVQMLIDRKILKGEEEKIMTELEAREQDIRTEELRDARVDSLARELREAWNKLPEQ